MLGAQLIRPTQLFHSSRIYDFMGRGRFHVDVPEINEAKAVWKIPASFSVILQTCSSSRAGRAHNSYQEFVVHCVLCQ